MASTAPGHGARRFMHALAAMLLVACSLPCASGNDASSAKAVQEKARALFEAIGGNHPALESSAAAGAVAAVHNPAEWTSPGSLLDRGTALLNEGNSKDAVVALDAAIAGWETEMGSKKLDSDSAALTAQRLGEALFLEGEDERAAAAFARAATASEALFGGDSPQAVASFTGLGLALQRQGKQLPDAVSALARALRARALRPDEGMVMATHDATKNLEGLVRALLDQPTEEGQSELAGALSAVDHTNRLAWRYFVQKLPYEGESVMQEVLDSMRRDEEQEEDGDDDGSIVPSPPRDLVVSALLFNLGFLRLAVLGKYESAAEVLQEAHALRERVLGPVHTLTVQAMISRGWALTLSGETLMAVKELSSTAQALLSDGQAHAADRLLRQALQQGSDPLGPGTYSNACYTQHGNMLRGWGTEGVAKATEFSQTQMDLAKKSKLKGKEPAMTRAHKLLAEALRAQIEDPANGFDLLKLSQGDKEQLFDEIKLHRK